MRPDSSDETERVGRGEAAVVHLMRGDHARARRVAEGTLELMARLSPSAFHLVYGYAATCEVFLALYEADRDAGPRAPGPRAPAAPSAATPASSPSAGPTRTASRASAPRIEGNVARAERIVREEHRRSRSSSACRSKPAQASYELGRLLPASDPRRAEHLARAREAFEQPRRALVARPRDAAIAATRRAAGARGLNRARRARARSLRGMSRRASERAAAGGGSACRKSSRWSRASSSGSI